VTRPGGFGIYLHWPYCSAICPYCDFNVRRDRGGDHSDLVDAIIADLQGQARRTDARGAQTLFIGGGTPSLLKARDVERLIAAARVQFGLLADAEISLECNPEDRGGFGDLVRAGVTRLSLGVQSFRAAGLLELGRRHSVRDGEEAVAAAHESGARVSIDMIYGRDGQSTEDWRAELKLALAAPIEHVSLYQLTIEAGTPFARAVARGRMNAIGVERAADLYTLTQDVCEEAGFPAYEISNHARGAAAQARHNLIYWRSGEWIGVGPGAHGRVMLEGVRTATRTHGDPAAYQRAVGAHGVGWDSVEALGDAAIAQEHLLMGLRLREGLERGAFNAQRLADLQAGGLIETDANRLWLTKAGRLVADRVALELLD